MFLLEKIAKIICNLLCLATPLRVWDGEVMIIWLIIAWLIVICQMVT